MQWPDIFFKARPPKRGERNSPTLAASVQAEPNPVREIEPDLPPADAAHRLPVSKVTLPPAPVHPLSSDRDVIRDMAEADTVRQLSRSGGVRLIKRDFPHPVESPAEAAGAGVAGAPGHKKASGMISPALRASAASASAGENEVPASAPGSDADKTESPSGGTRGSPSINLTGSRELGPAGVRPSAMTIFRRRTKIADVARVVLPPRRDESPSTPGRHPGVPAAPSPAAVPASSESAGVVIPAAFPVALPTRPAPPEELSAADSAPKPSAETKATSTVESIPTTPESALPATTADDRVPEIPGKVPPPSSAGMSPPPTEPGAHKSELFRPEAPAASPKAADTSSAFPALSSSTARETGEKREFLLSNGERILGHILSETPESIYIDHGTLGVLTIPRAQIAQRPVEIILINGDRVVGDIIAETPDALFVRHASLGILTVPRNQRSTRVVEAILKDGDRILGEVLGETENFTVIRSATLGTVAVPHNRVAMLNRRAEQVEMKALPAPITTPVPGLEDKPAPPS